MPVRAKWVSSAKMRKTGDKTFISKLSGWLGLFLLLLNLISFSGYAGNAVFSPQQKAGTEWVFRLQQQAEQQRVAVKRIKSSLSQSKFVFAASKIYTCLLLLQSRLVKLAFVNMSGKMYSYENIQRLIPQKTIPQNTDADSFFL